MSTATRAGMSCRPSFATEAGRREWLVRELERERAGDGPPSEENARRGAVARIRWTGLTPSGSSRGRRAGRGGCAKRAASWTRSGGRPPGRSRGRGPSVCGWRRGGWRTISRPRSAGTRPMRRFGSTAACMTAAAGRDPEAVLAAGDPAGRGERDRPGLAADEGQPPLHPGLQRAGGRQRAADRDRGGDHRRRRRLLAPATDARPPRSTSSRRPGSTDKPEVAVADAQYWNEQHMDDVTAEHGIPVLIPPDSGKRKGERPGWTGGRYSFMRRVLATDLGRETYRKRQTVDRAGVRSHQTQPQIHQLPPKRPSRRADRVAINHDESQPHQAPPPRSRFSHLRRRNGTDSAPTAEVDPSRRPPPVKIALGGRNPLCDVHRGRQASPRPHQAAIWASGSLAVALVLSRWLEQEALVRAVAAVARRQVGKAPAADDGALSPRWRSLRGRGLCARHLEVGAAVARADQDQRRHEPERRDRGAAQERGLESIRQRVREARPARQQRGGCGWWRSSRARPGRARRRSAARC